MKTLGKIIGVFLALPYLLGFVLLRLILGYERAFIGVSEAIAVLPTTFGIYARQFYYAAVLAGVGDDVHFGFMSLFSKAAATLGDRVYIGRFCTIGLATIGDEVMLADGVQVLSGRHQHGRDAAAGQSRHGIEQTFSKVTIGKGAWIGANAVIMADVGEGAIVGAGAVVVKPVEAGQKVGGVPAKSI